MDIVNTGASPIGVAIVPTTAPGAVSDFDLAKEISRSTYKVVSPAGTQNRARIVNTLDTAFTLSLTNATTSLENLVNVRT